MSFEICSVQAKPDDKNHGAHSNFPLCALKTIIDAKKEFSLPGKNKKFLPFPKLISSSQHPIKRRESEGERGGMLSGPGSDLQVVGLLQHASLVAPEALDRQK